MKKLLYIVSSLALMAGFVMTLAPVAAFASPASSIKDGVNKVGGGNEVSLESRIKTVVNILFFVLGTIAVIMIIVGGIRYATSGGDSGSTKAAKDTVLYSVVGLIVAIMAYAIVGFIIDSF